MIAVKAVPGGAAEDWKACYSRVVMKDAMKDFIPLLSGSLQPPAVRVAARRHQQLPLSLGADQNAYVIGRGIHLARAPIANTRHQVLGILYPGDFVHAGTLPPFEGVAIISVSEVGEAWRMRWSAAKLLVNERPDLARRIADNVADQAARTALHNAIIAGLASDERVAALFIEIALRTGTRTPFGIRFEMPLSRTDIAEHLALNADTVSRILSRMSATGRIVSAGKHRMKSAAIDALAEDCPLSPALMRMHARNHCEASHHVPERTSQPESA